MSNELVGVKVAILAANGFEQVELVEPRKALEAAGATIQVVSLKAGKIRGWKETDWGDEIPVDLVVSETYSSDFDALLLPGGQMNPDFLRVNADAVKFVSGFLEGKKPIAAICHAPWTLIETGRLKGLRLTSFHSLQTDLRNAGALWSDEPVVTDQGLVTSRQPSDIPAFNAKMIEEFAEGKHQKRITEKAAASTI